MKYYVDFDGWCEIEAKDENDAREKFWALVNEDKPLPHTTYTIEDVEKKED